MDWGKSTTTAAERRGDSLKGFKEFYLKAKAIIWPRLAYFVKVRLKADTRIDCQTIPKMAWGVCGTDPSTLERKGLGSPDWWAQIDWGRENSVRRHRCRATVRFSLLNLKVGTEFWPWLSYMCQLRSKADLEFGAKCKCIFVFGEALITWSL